MASGSRPKRWDFVSSITVLCFVAATTQADALACLPPSDLDTLIITHDSAKLGWKSATALGQHSKYCVCTSPGNAGQVCSQENTPPDCYANVMGHVTVRPNLKADASYTTCVQTQCSGVLFSSPICKTFRMSPKGLSAQYQVVDAKRSSSSLGISWRLPRPPRGRLAGYRLRWCQSSKCVTTEQLLQRTSKQTLSPKDLQPYRQYTLYASAFSVDPASSQKLYGEETSLIVYTLQTHIEKESIHLQIKATNSSTLLVSWPEPSGDSTQSQHYLVTWWKANEMGIHPPSTQNETIPATSTRFFIYGLEPGATYHIVLSRAEENYDVNVPGTDEHPDVYRAPDAVHAEVKRFLNRSVVSVTWDTSRFGNQDRPAQRYSVKLCPICGDKAEAKRGECVSIAVAANSGKAVFNDLKDACQYRVEVRALVEEPDGETEEGEPAVLFFTTLAALLQEQPDPYEKPGGLRANVKRFLNSSFVTVTWNAFQGSDESDSLVRQYAVTLCPACAEGSQGTDAECRTVAASASVAKAVFHNLKGLCNYTVDVRALVESVDGTMDEGEPAITVFTSPPPKLPALKDSLQVELYGNHATVYWASLAAGLEEYEVFYYVKLLGPAQNPVVEEAVSGTEKTFTDLEPGAIYSVDVLLCVARAKMQHCGATTTLKFRTLSSGVSGSVTQLTVTATGPTQLQVSWKSPIEDEDVKRYRVSWWRDEPREADASEIGNVTVPVTKTTIMIGGLEAYTSYTVEVVAVYGRRNITWHGSPTNASATTDPNSPPHVASISITTTKPTQSSSDVLISWTTTNATVKSSAHIEYYVTLCIGTDDIPGNCRNQTVAGRNSVAAFSGVKHHAALFVGVQPYIKAADRLIEGQASAARGVSWTPPIPSVRDLIVDDITGNSASVSWSEIKEVVGTDGGYYAVVLRQHPEVMDNDNATGEQVAEQIEAEQLVVLNVTTRAAEIELRDLRPWKNYTLAVYAAIAGSGLVVEGNASSEVFQTPPEPPGKPRNVSVVERQGDHYLTWLPPESWNGPRSGYEVSITCMNGNIRANSTSVAIKADTVELKIPRLSPGVPCSLGIYAYNVYQGDSMDGAKVRVRFTPPQQEGAVASERPGTD